MPRPGITVKQTNTPNIKEEFQPPDLDDGSGPNG
jgi:hypothetical protein